MENKIKLFKITTEVAEYYRENTRDNSKCTEAEVIKRLTRNVYCSRKLEDYNGMQSYLYGQLLIFIKNNTIVELSNYTIGGNWHRDVKKYKRLNKALGIVI